MFLPIVALIGTESVCLAVSLVAGRDLLSALLLIAKAMMDHSALL